MKAMVSATFQRLSFLASAPALSDGAAADTVTTSILQTYRTNRADPGSVPVLCEQYVAIGHGGIYEIVHDTWVPGEPGSFNIAAQDGDNKKLSRPAMIAIMRAHEDRLQRKYDQNITLRNLGSDITHISLQKDPGAARLVPQ